MLTLPLLGLANMIVFEQMSSEQLGQLYELMHATKDVWKQPETLESEHQNTLS
jgi:hypothetical protein